MCLGSYKEAGQESANPLKQSHLIKVLCAETTARFILLFETILEGVSIKIKAVICSASKCLRGFSNLYMILEILYHPNASVFKTKRTYVAIN